MLFLCRRLYENSYEPLFVVSATSSASTSSSRSNETTTSTATSSPYSTRLSSNLPNLLDASVTNYFGDSCVLKRFGITALGQYYVLVVRKRMMGGYTTNMITANMRNRPFISEPMKISGIQTLEEAKEFVGRLTDTLAKQEMLSLGDQPKGVQIPYTKEALQLDLIPEDVHDDPDKFLAKGDEVFIEIGMSSIRFFHSGIYAGKGYVYHFISEPCDNNLASALTIFRGTPGHVLVEDWDNFVYALIERGSVAPRVFRVTHPLIIRSGNTVIEEAERLKDELRIYDIRSSNCQHFTSLCSRGVATSYDMQSSAKLIACTLMIPSSKIVSTLSFGSNSKYGS